MILGWFVTDVINLFSGLIFSWLLAIIMPIEIYSLISIAVAYSSIIQVFIRSNTVLIAYQAKNDEGFLNLYNSVFIRHIGIVFFIGILTLIFLMYFKIKITYFLLCAISIDTGNTLWGIKRFSLGRFKYGYLFSLFRVCKLLILLAGLILISNSDINSTGSKFYVLLYSIISISPLLAAISIRDLKINQSISYKKLIRNFFNISNIVINFVKFFRNLYISFKKSFKKSLKLLPQVWLGSYVIISLSYRNASLDLISIIAIGKLISGLSSTLFLAKVNSLLERSNEKIIGDLNKVLISRVKQCFKIFQYGLLSSLLLSIGAFIFKESYFFELIINTNKGSAIELAFENKYLIFVFLYSFLGVLLTANAYLWNFYQTTKANSNISSLIIILNIIIFSLLVYKFEPLTPTILVGFESISNIVIFTLFALGIPNKKFFKY